MSKKQQVQERWGRRYLKSNRGPEGYNLLSILAIGGVSSPFIAFHLQLGDVAENSSELPFFLSHSCGFACLGQAEESCHHLLEQTVNEKGIGEIAVKTLERVVVDLGRGVLHFCFNSSQKSPLCQGQGACSRRGE